MHYRRYNYLSGKGSSMFQFKIGILIMAVCLGSYVEQVNANLIINGSFENNPVKHGSWKWFQSNDVAGWQGSNIEIWNNLFGIDAVDGVNIIELNAHPKSATQFSINQSFNSQPNVEYTLSFYYRARKSLSEAFAVSLLNVNIPFYHQVLDDHTTSEWRYFTTVFSAQSALTTLVLSSITPLSGTNGNLIDSILIIDSSAEQPYLSVSEPPLLGLLLLSVFGFQRLRLMS